MRDLNLLEPETWPWPFSQSDLMAGLRRTLEQPSLQLVDVQPLTLIDRRPAVGRIRGLLVTYQVGDHTDSVRLVAKEPVGTTRAGLAGVGRREVGFYRRLAAQVPLPTPRLINANSQGDWLLLEYLTFQRPSDKWTAADYLHAVDQLADMHNRFWNLGEDLEAFPWLGNPLASDFAVHRAAADKAIARIVAAAVPEPLAGFPGRRWLLERLAAEAERITAPLRHQPPTLLHGDYWPGNIALVADGEQAVFDWQLAGTGPGVLDLLVFINKSEWWFGPLPLGSTDLIVRYRRRMDEQGGITWSDDEWDLLWDHGLMWRFVQEWLDLLALIPLPVLATRAEQLDRVWLQPVEDALARRIGAGSGVQST